MTAAVGGHAILVLAVAAAVVTASPPVRLSAQAVDRTRPPALPPPPALRLPAVQTTTLPNGLTLAVVEMHKVPVVDEQLHVDDGHLVHLDHGERETVGERRGLDGREPERGGRRQYGWLGAIDGLGGQADGRTGCQYRRCHREHQDRLSPDRRRHGFTASSGLPRGTTLSTTRWAPVR